MTAPSHTSTPKEPSFSVASSIGDRVQNSVAEGAKARALQVALVVGGFPTAERPDQGVFSLRLALALQKLTHVRVIHIRGWRPGRALVQSSRYEGLRVDTVAVPQLPDFSDRANVAFLRHFAWPLIRTQLRECQIIHSVALAPLGIAASHWAARARIHHVSQAIGGDVNVILPRMKRQRFWPDWTRHLHGIACNSNRLAEAILDLLPTARNVRTLYRGVDLNLFHPSGPQDGEFASRPPVRFLFLGGFPPAGTRPNGTGTNIKGGVTLLEAWKRTEAQLSALGATLTIAGPGSETDSIACWHSELRFPEQVHIAGMLSPQSIPDYLRGCDVLLVPSMEEGLPNTAVEASACERAVFGSEVGGIPEVIRSGETGLIVPSGCVESWANAMVKYAASPDVLRRMGAAARLRMEQCFNKDQYAPGIVDLYEAAMRERVDS